VVLPAFSILSDIFSHSWYPMVIPCYPMVIFSVEKNNLSQLSHVTPWFGWWSSMKILGRLRGEENCVTTGYSEGAKEEVRRTGCWLLFYCRPLDGSWYVLLLVKNGRPTTGLVCAGWLHFFPLLMDVVAFQQ
jgi:hypothetical protein